MHSSKILGDADESDCEICKMQPETGDCRALIQRYYYDVKAEDCKKFQYGGCGGNRNNFKTIEDCRKKCLHLKEE